MVKMIRSRRGTLNCTRKMTVINGQYLSCHRQYPIDYDISSISSELTNWTESTIDIGSETNVNANISDHLVIKDDSQDQTRTTSFVEEDEHTLNIILEVVGCVLLLALIILGCFWSKSRRDTGGLAAEREPLMKRQEQSGETGKICVEHQAEAPQRKKMATPTLSKYKSEITIFANAAASFSERAARDSVSDDTTEASSSEQEGQSVARPMSAAHAFEQRNRALLHKRQKSLLRVQYEVLTMNVGATGEERLLAKKALKAACSGGYIEIVKELLHRWVGVGSLPTPAQIILSENDEPERDSNSKISEYQYDVGSSSFSSSSSEVVQNPYNLTQEEKERWVQELIDESKVIYSVSVGGHASILDLLLNVNNVNVNVSNSKGTTALYQACSKGHLTVVQTLLKITKVDVNKPRTIDGCTPLYVASCKDRVEIVRALLSHNDIDVNQANRKNETPLIYASYEGHIAVVCLLLTKPNVDLNKKATNKTALQWATQNNHVDVVHLLQDHLDGHRSGSPVDRRCERTIIL